MAVCGNGGKNDRLEQQNGTKRTTEERPLDCLLLAFYYYICRMDVINAIGLISSLLGILSFFGIGISISSLFKKNLFSNSRVLPYGLDEALLLLKKI